ncbi:hypothetical protein G6045_08600 [Streptomyces sp. YC504]|uniref:Uncharacterized protein n=1 Tax=Streptomyces mesophilus TaxID=1775132 RepID=A0A6G4XDX4_9ACTN|nr:hypothetical protein [Streptomyces mesophilus]NGO75735.1 hypothetical protein [Streptomyces mesophilus]
MSENSAVLPAADAHPEMAQFAHLVRPSLRRGRLSDESGCSLGTPTDGPVS